MYAGKSEVSSLWMSLAERPDCCPGGDRSASGNFGASGTQRTDGSADVANTYLASPRMAPKPVPTLQLAKKDDKGPSRSKTGADSDDPYALGESGADGTGTQASSDC
eukprot:gene31990-22010_t